MSDLFDKSNVATVIWHSWKEVGDSISGTYIEHKEIPSDMTQSGTQHVYILVKESGEKVNVPAPGGRELKPMQNIPLGAFIGIKFDGELPSNKKGWNATKQINVYWDKRMELDVLQNHIGGKIQFDKSEVIEAPKEDNKLPPL